MIETELIAGLYDENDNLIVTYEESGLIADANYTSSSSTTNAGSGYSTFNRYPAAKKVILPASITSIGSYAFSGCSTMTSIVVPDSIISIGSSAFSGCSALTEMTIPFVGAQAGVTSSDTNQYPLGYIFGTSSYTGGAKTTQIYYGSTSSTISTNYYIPTSLKKVAVTGGNILYGAFYNCKNLTSIIIQDGVTSIGNRAFYGCSSLVELVIPFVGAKAGVTSSDVNQYPFGYLFGTSSYTGSTSTTQYYYGSSTSSTTSSTYYIPSSLKKVTVTGGNILYGAFYNCSNLTNITIGNGATSIGDYAFYNCTSLTSITIPESVTSIGEEAFRGCTGLTSITIPDSVTSISNYAFYSCTGLTSITIQASVTSIGNNAFYNCSKLRKIYITDLAS